MDAGAVGTAVPEINVVKIANDADEEIRIERAEEEEQQQPPQQQQSPQSDKEKDKDKDTKDKEKEEGSLLHRSSGFFFSTPKKHKRNRSDNQQQLNSSGEERLLVVDKRKRVGSDKEGKSKDKSPPGSKKDGGSPNGNQEDDEGEGSGLMPEKRKLGKRLRYSLLTKRMSINEKNAKSPSLVRKSKIAPHEPVISAPNNFQSKVHVDFDFQWTTGDEDPAAQFQFIAKLGEGAHGRVYKAIHKDTGFVLAIKCLSVPASADKSGEGKDIESLRKEIGILRACRSPYIVSYYGVCFRNNYLWIMMESCDMGSLMDVMKVLRIKGSMPEDDIAYILKNVIHGLIYLHSAKVIHRDLKAGNILLTKTGQPKLADFGTSAQLQTMSHAKTFTGTPLFMSPEALNEMNYGVKSDIWSLAITAIQIAEGKPPRIGMNLAKAILAIINDPPPTFQDPAKWSDRFREFVSTCLRKNPDHRPSAQDLLQHPFIASVPENYELGIIKKYKAMMKEDEKSGKGKSFLGDEMMMAADDGILVEALSPAAVEIRHRILEKSHHAKKDGDAIAGGDLPHGSNYYDDSGVDYQEKREHSAAGENGDEEPLQQRMRRAATVGGGLAPYAAGSTPAGNFSPPVHPSQQGDAELQEKEKKPRRPPPPIPQHQSPHRQQQTPSPPPQTQQSRDVADDKADNLIRQQPSDVNNPKFEVRNLRLTGFVKSQRILFERMSASDDNMSASLEPGNAGVNGYPPRSISHITRQPGAANPRAMNARRMNRKSKSFSNFGSNPFVSLIKEQKARAKEDPVRRITTTTNHNSNDRHNNNPLEGSGVNQNNNNNNPQQQPSQPQAHQQPQSPQHNVQSEQQPQQQQKQQGMHNSAERRVTIATAEKNEEQAKEAGRDLEKPKPATHESSGATSGNSDKVGDSAFVMIDDYRSNEDEDRDNIAHNDHPKNQQQPPAPAATGLRQSQEKDKEKQSAPSAPATSLAITTALTTKKSYSDRDAASMHSVNSRDDVIRDLQVQLERERERTRQALREAERWRNTAEAYEGRLLALGQKL